MRAELLWFLCGNFHIFVTMATVVGLTQISLTQLNRQFPKTLIWRKHLDDISYRSWVIADFLMKFIDFCYHGNQGGSSENLNDSIGLADPQKPPHWCKILGSILSASCVIVIFVWKFPHFRYHGNRGWSDTNITYTVKSAVRENPIWRKYLDDISYTRWVIADFMMQFTDFCYHGNKGGSSENLNDSVGLADPENLYTGAKFWDLS